MLKGVLTITKKELKEYFATPMAYILLGLFAIVAGGFFVRTLFVNNQASLRVLLEFIPLLWIVIIPAMTMRSFADERKTGTIEVITTLPVSKLQIILGKIFTNWLMTLIMLLLTLPAIITVMVLGSPDMGEMLAGYIGLMFVSMTYIVIGTYISLKSKNQIASFLVSVVAISILYFIGEEFVLEQIPVGYRSVVEFIGLSAHYRSMARGVIDTRDVVYYLSIIIVGIALTNEAYKKLIKSGK